MSWREQYGLYIYLYLYLYLYLHLYLYIYNPAPSHVVHWGCPGGAQPGHPQYVLAAPRQDILAAPRQDIPIRELQAFHIYLSH
jgi:hypothetical protein